ncbi:hypothetical protein C0991_003633 [Blastosporella zonata]|nr:hypothetical protein C0991_003633 [Blastosporella zonata]
MGILGTATLPEEGDPMDGKQVDDDGGHNEEGDSQHSDEPNGIDRINSDNNDGPEDGSAKATNLPQSDNNDDDLTAAPTHHNKKDARPAKSSTRKRKFNQHDTAPTTNPQTPARPGLSKPAPPAPTKKAKISGLEEFVAVGQAEEVTRQKELELAKAKVEANSRVRIAQEESRARIEEMKLKTKLEMRKMRLEHSRQKLEQRKQLAQLKYRSYGPDPSTATPELPAMLFDHSLDSSFDNYSNSSSPSPFVEGNSGSSSSFQPYNFL